MSDQTRALAEALCHEGPDDEEAWAFTVNNIPSFDRALTRTLDRYALSLVPTATLEALERVRDAAQRVIDEGTWHCDDTHPALRAALEVGPT